MNHVEKLKFINALSAAKLEGKYMGRPKISREVFEQRIQQRFPEETFRVIEYSSIGEKARIQCLRCNTIIDVSKANNFLAPNKVFGCVSCHGLHIKRVQQINKLLLDYIILDDTQVRDTHRVYHLKCKNCGHERETLLSNFIAHPKCGCETGTFRRTQQEFQDLLGEHYESLEVFSGMLQKIKVRHKTCGFIWEARPSDFKNKGLKCPHCYRRESQGEHLVAKFLKESGLSFEREKTIPGSKLRFDFYLIYNDQPFAIEYNGEQHYKQSKLYHSCEEDFLLQQKRDANKMELAKQLNITLIIIPYTEKKITELLDSYFSQPKGSTTIM